MHELRLTRFGRAICRRALHANSSDRFILFDKANHRESARAFLRASSHANRSTDALDNTAHIFAIQHSPKDDFGQECQHLRAAKPIEPGAFWALLAVQETPVEAAPQSVIEDKRRPDFRFERSHDCWLILWPYDDKQFAHLGAGVVRVSHGKALEFHGRACINRAGNQCKNYYWMICEVGVIKWCLLLKIILCIICYHEQFQ
jgi:hypothetical protein